MPRLVARFRLPFGIPIGTMNLATLRTWLPDRWLNQLTLAPTDLLRDATYRRLWTSILISCFGGLMHLLAVPPTTAVVTEAAVPPIGQPAANRNTALVRIFLSTRR